MAADGKGASRRRRRRTWRLGKTAEARAVWMLRLKGYRIVARRYRTAVGEIDIVARRGSLLAMIEVKARDRDIPVSMSASTRCSSGPGAGRRTSKTPGAKIERPINPGVGGGGWDR